MTGPNDQFPFPFPQQDEEKPATAPAATHPDEGLPAFPAIDIPVPATVPPVAPPLPTTPVPGGGGPGWPAFPTGAPGQAFPEASPTRGRGDGGLASALPAGGAGEAVALPASRPGQGGAEPLTDDEVADLRRLLGLFGPRWLQRVAEGGLPLRAPGAKAEHGDAGPSPLPAFGAEPAGALGGPTGGLAGAVGAPGPFTFPVPAAPLSMAPSGQPGASVTSVGPPAAPVVPPETLVRNALLAWLERVPVEGPEREAGARLREVLGSIAPGPVFLAACQAVTAAFPAAQALRFGTPDQKQFALSAATDRALAHLAGHAFPERGRLLKALAAWASTVAGSFTFLTAEGDPFNNQYWERLPAASPSGKTIREVHGFLVIRSDTRQVVRLGRALT